MGALSGAMRYCEERYGGSERRYRNPRLRTAKVVDDTSSREKLRALAARERAYESGQFLGNPLDGKAYRDLLRPTTTRFIRPHCRSSLRGNWPAAPAAQALRAASSRRHRAFDRRRTVPYRALMRWAHPRPRRASLRQRAHSRPRDAAR
jgi:hypothetical protein